ncbi:MAG: Gram-negative bacterial tonB protein [Bacteroidetes bacterium ADurb.Bin416]|nr:MAG: Gram-negative bacterial tonB protein [Bacteroidetes bacterium ADurb.Bin416]
MKNPDDKLQFSCVGYKSVTIPRSNYSSVTAPHFQLNGDPNKPMTVALDEAMMELAETVVVGYVPNNQAKNSKETTNDEYLLVEKLATFPGGEEALMNYLSQNLRYPTGALEKGIEGGVVCSCVISASGKVTEAIVSRSVDPDLDAEAVRVILNMPNWDPALQNGKPMPVKVSIPITFKRQKS